MSLVSPSRLRAASLALIALAALPAGAAPLTNGSFHSGLAGWTVLGNNQVVADFSSTHDAGERHTSGALRLTDVNPAASGGGWGVLQCLTVVGGDLLHVRAWMLAPAGQARTGEGNASLHFYSDAGCQQSLGPGTGAGSEETGRWTLLDLSHTEVPAGAHSARFDLTVRKTQAGGTYQAYFDEVRVCSASGCGALGEALEPPEFWDFNFRALIGDTPARLEPSSACLPQTVCLSGALPGRTEVMLRVIGPKPNGYRWLQVVRFTPAEVVLEAVQFGGGPQIRRAYLLGASSPGERPMNLEDRSSFLPFAD